MLGFGIIITSLCIGIAGYHWIEGLSWIDSYLEAAMILSGMGPTSNLYTTGGKIFSGIFALFSGLALILIVGVMAAPLLHRFLHRFHVDTDDKKES